ncbi:hypothetical protein C0580_03925 [Candidatus Parcubacteria bacterium]|nr:MAG: hypothetical protein C0580_03925 [Candidatus Parcubacteria bacterium]
MSWQSLKEIADNSLEQKGIKLKIKESLVIEQANDIIGNFFGADARSKSRAIYLKDGELIIAVLCRDLYVEIESQQGQFIRILNNRFSDIVVYRLKFLG